GWQQQRNQDGNNGNYNQQLNQRETTPCAPQERHLTHCTDSPIKKTGQNKQVVDFCKRSRSRLRPAAPSKNRLSKCTTLNWPLTIVSCERPEILLCGECPERWCVRLVRHGTASWQAGCPPGAIQAKSGHLCRVVA